MGDVHNMQIETTDLSERDAPNVKIGQAANIYIEPLDAQVTGRVIHISPMPEIVGGDVTYQVKISLDEQPEGILWGMSAEAEIQVGK
jgi:HlyD family secretion protein